jgi:hypothetical protein
MRLKAQGLTTAGRKRGPEKMPVAALQLLALDIFQARLARYACADDWGVNAFCWCAGGLGAQGPAVFFAPFLAL